MRRTLIALALFVVYLSVPAGAQTYVASVGAQATTAAVTLSVEASATKSLRLVSFCVATSPATAAAKVDVVIQRRTTASTGGTACTAEGTTAGGCAVSKTSTASADFPGIARLGGTPGTAGAVLGQWGFVVGEIGAGAADPPGPAAWCYDYSDNLAAAPVIPAGVANGVSINVSAAGSGGLASGAIMATVVAE